jgi:hypothetical protein
MPQSKVLHRKVRQGRKGRSKSHYERTLQSTRGQTTAQKKPKSRLSAEAVGKRSRTQPVDIVNEQLTTYAQRGVFRSFSQTRAASTQGEFHFYWLWDLPFHLSFDGKRKALSFKNLLPGIPARSELNIKLKAFIKSRCSSDQPEHRRLDPKRVSVRYTNLRGNVSIAFLVLEGDYEYAIKKALNLVNEIFVGFLNVYFPEYMAEHFRRPEE